MSELFGRTLLDDDSLYLSDDDFYDDDSSDDDTYTEETTMEEIMHEAERVITKSKVSRDPGKTVVEPKGQNFQLVIHEQPAFSEAQEAQSFGSSAEDRQAQSSSVQEEMVQPRELVVEDENHFQVLIHEPPVYTEKDDQSHISDSETVSSRASAINNTRTSADDSPSKKAVVKWADDENDIFAGIEDKPANTSSSTAAVGAAAAAASAAVIGASAIELTSAVDSSGNGAVVESQEPISKKRTKQKRGKFFRKLAPRRKKLSRKPSTKVIPEEDDTTPSIFQVPSITSVDIPGKDAVEVTSGDEEANLVESPSQNCQIGVDREDKKLVAAPAAADKANDMKPITVPVILKKPKSKKTTAVPIAFEDKPDKISTEGSRNEEPVIEKKKSLSFVEGVSFMGSDTGGTHENTDDNGLSESEQGELLGFEIELDEKLLRKQRKKKKRGWIKSKLSRSASQASISKNISNLLESDNDNASAASRPSLGSSRSSLSVKSSVSRRSVFSGRSATSKRSALSSKSKSSRKSVFSSKSGTSRKSTSSRRSIKSVLSQSSGVSALRSMGSRFSQRRRQRRQRLDEANKKHAKRKFMVSVACLFVRTCHHFI